MINGNDKWLLGQSLDTSEQLNQNWMLPITVCVYKRLCLLFATCLNSNTSDPMVPKCFSGLPGPLVRAVMG